MIATAPAEDLSWLICITDTSQYILYQLHECPMEAEHIDLKLKLTAEY